MEVIDNFLPEYQFQQISYVILSDDFPWYWNEGVVCNYGDDNNPRSYQFTNTFFNIRHGGVIAPNSYSLVDIVQQKLGVGCLDRIKQSDYYKLKRTSSGNWSKKFLDAKDTYLSGMNKNFREVNLLNRFVKKHIKLITPNKKLGYLDGLFEDEE